MEIFSAFVYGSLLSGMWNHDRFCRDAVAIEPAVTTGRLYHLPYGFPAMFDLPAAQRRRHGASDGQVFGEVLTFADIEKTLDWLDGLEGYRPGGRSHYLRIRKTVAVLPENRRVMAWVYVYPEGRFAGNERKWNFHFFRRLEGLSEKFRRR